MAGRRKRRQLAEQQFSTAMEDLDQELTVLRKRIQEALGDQDVPVQEGTYLFLTEARQRLQTIVQRNFDAVLKEADVSQRIRESRHRMQSDDEIRRRLEEIVVPRNFVLIDDVRGLMRTQLQTLLAEGGPFELRNEDDISFLIDAALPPPPRRETYVEALLKGWSATHPLSGSIG